MKKADKIVETSIVTYKEQALAELKITPAEIAKKVTEYMALKVLPDDPKSYRTAREALTTCVHTRTGVDKRRKELNEDDQARIKARNEAAKELVAPLAPAEKHLEDELGLEDGRRAEVKAEKARKEKERVDGIRAKIESFRAIILTLPGKTVKQLGDILDNVIDSEAPAETFQEFKAEADKVRGEVLDAVTQAIEARKAQDRKEAAQKVEAERLAQQKAEQDAIAAAQAEERRKIEEEKARIAAEKRAEQERRDREEFERKAKERAEAEAHAKVEREAAEKRAREEAEAKAKAEREAKEAVEKARQESLRPDREKIMAFAEAVIAVRPPEMKDKKAIKCVNAAVEKIDRAISEMREEAKRL